MTINWAEVFPQTILTEDDGRSFFNVMKPGETEQNVISHLIYLDKLPQTEQACMAFFLAWIDAATLALNGGLNILEEAMVAGALVGFDTTSVITEHPVIQKLNDHTWLIGELGKYIAPGFIPEPLDSNGVEGYWALRIASLVQNYDIVDILRAHMTNPMLAPIHYWY